MHGTHDQCYYKLQLLQLKHASKEHRKISHEVETFPLLHAHFHRGMPACATSTVIDKKQQGTELSFGSNCHDHTSKVCVSYG